MKWKEMAFIYNIIVICHIYIIFYIGTERQLFWFSLGIMLIDVLITFNYIV